MASNITAHREPDQERLVQEAVAAVKEQAYFLKRAIAESNMRDMLKFVSNMLHELRAQFVCPKSYYEIYMVVFNELQIFSAYLCGKSNEIDFHALYDRVQRAGNIIPRLYLLITVGSAYIKSLTVSAKEILNDLTELCKGVQHPIRGLFLRYYLAQMCKDILPDHNTAYEGEEGGKFEDAFEFLLKNFTESTRLWVRLKSHGVVAEKYIREKERHELRILVGANLVRMTLLEGVTPEFYHNIALPKILEEVIINDDAMAQQYLMDCIIQVFEDECHILSLDKFLNACLQLCPEVDLKLILSNLINRLTNFIEKHPPASDNIFESISKVIDKLSSRYIGSLSEEEKSGNSDVLELLSTFMQSTLTLYPGSFEKVDSILGSAVYFLACCADRGQAIPEESVECVFKLLSMPLKDLALKCLTLEQYGHLIGFLEKTDRINVALAMIEAVANAKIMFEDAATLQLFLDMLGPLVRDNSNEIVSLPKFNEALIDLGAFVHLLHNPDTDVAFEFLQITKQSIGDGCALRVKSTYPPLVFSALKLVTLIFERDALVMSGAEGVLPGVVTLKKVFQFIHVTCVKFASFAPEAALRLFLIVAGAANDVDVAGQYSFEQICYEFLSQAFICYEEDLTESRSQYQALHLMIGTLVGRITCLEPDNYETLATKASLHSAKLLKKPDQCRAILMSSHLFWNNTRYRDSCRVLECLQKCLKIADVAVQSSSANVGLFIEILDKYLYFFEASNPEVTPQFIENLITLCVEHVKYSDVETHEKIIKHFDNTIDYIKLKEKDSTSKYTKLNLSTLECVEAT